MAILIKVLNDDDGYPYSDSYWHLGTKIFKDSPRILCTGEPYGFGESSMVYESLIINNGLIKITCPNCIAIIKELQKVKIS